MPAVLLLHDQDRSDSFPAPLPSLKVSFRLRWQQIPFSIVSVEIISRVTFCQLPSASSQDPVKVGQLNLISWTYN